MDNPIGNRSLMLRYVLLAIGWLSVALGVIGIFLPVLPTTPFLLLAAACFARSSPRFYQWLVQHPRLGPWIRDYRSGNHVDSVVHGYDSTTCTGTFGQTFNGARFTSSNIVTLCTAQGC